MVQEGLHLGRIFAAGMLVVVVLHLLFPPVVGKHVLESPKSDPFRVPLQWRQSGDVLISGIMSQIIYIAYKYSFKKHPLKDFPDSYCMVTKFYQHALTLVFAINEINENPKLLPNVTLGFHIYDSYYFEKMTYHNTLDLLFRSYRFIPNYRCSASKNLLAVIGGLGSVTSLCMSDILSLYKIPQFPYGSFGLGQRESVKLPFSYHSTSKESHQNMAIIWILRHFGWTWVGLFAVDGDNGEVFLHTLEQLLSQHGMCSAFTLQLPQKIRSSSMTEIANMLTKADLFLRDSKASVHIIYGDTLTMLFMITLIVSLDSNHKKHTSSGKVWITTSQIDFAVSHSERHFDLTVFHGTISLSVQSPGLRAFENFLRNVEPSRTLDDGFTGAFWEQAFECSFQKYSGRKKCTGKERLEVLPGPVFEMHMTGHSYGIYNAVHAVAHASHTLYLSRTKSSSVLGSRSTQLGDPLPWQLHQFLKGISFNNSAGEIVSFDGERTMEVGLDIMNMAIYPNNSVVRPKVGRVQPNRLEQIEVTLQHDQLVWHGGFNQVLPISQCSDSCQPGFQKKKKEREKFCCYGCVPCPDGKISAQKDMDTCSNCPEDQYASKAHDQCIPKMVTFLSYEEPVGICLASVAGSLSLITLLVLRTFIKHKDTPIVRANNQDVSYALLISLLLCFLCVFLFLGKPKKLTCFFRQSVFSILFTVAVSCVLAKTVTVVVAFQATIPGSSMRKWMGKSVTNSIILSCSLIQMCICTVWLGTSPPFPDLDTKSLNEEIVAQCNEGPVIMFYIVLSYIGLLSSISFTVAFFARKLPDRFNEAKFIAFSMLMFCSVWLCFVPTYLSTKAKDMVAVEIFSILASGAGLLCFIFFPKCYIILLRPDMNKKEQVITRSH